jgi:hypothetical protein
MPTPMAIFNWAGTARNSASRSPVSTKIAMSTPSITTRPIASAQVIVGAISYATSAFTPRPAASASGKRATTPIRIVMTPATRAVAAAIWVMLSWSPFLSAPPPRINGLRTTI